jgi:predicted nucleotidyltransferase
VIDPEFSVPDWVRTVADDLAPRLGSVTGVRAVVLGGSHARGVGEENSDLDLGLFYSDDEPVDLDALQFVIDEVNDDLTTKPSALGALGPWVNGGASLHINRRSVDLHYRSIDRYRSTIENAQNGFAEHDYLQQPPYGFQSTIYLGEIDNSVPLHDPSGVVAWLQSEVRPYPTALREAIMRGYHWGAQAALDHALRPAERGDVYTVAGCVTRSIAFLVQVLFAANEVYFVSDRGAIASIDRMAVRPDGWKGRVERCLAFTGMRADLLATVDEASELVAECRTYVYG